MRRIQRHLELLLLILLFLLACNQTIAATSVESNCLNLAFLLGSNFDCFSEIYFYQIGTASLFVV
jgi:hypothetical protein